MGSRLRFLAGWGEGPAHLPERPAFHPDLPGAHRPFLACRKWRQAGPPDVSLGCLGGGPVGGLQSVPIRDWVPQPCSVMTARG